MTTPMDPVVEILVDFAKQGKVPIKGMTLERWNAVSHPYAIKFPDGTHERYATLWDAVQDLAILAKLL